ncbi:hypothetical protein [Actinotalea sp.]|uniref:hypothetical protein n=1 Tax=Actinotalea sp. TaxID=1872145 RepID=UPI002C350227|nr:hypothetical protein [Actinotalea sp.]HQY34247.1 hypothetical protein [Actinotalea sp.]HRA49477.1 hypothetical protein [Actinotalea sp.]
MDGVAAAVVTEVPWFWVATGLFGVMFFCIAVPASAAGKVDNLGIDSLNALQRRWPVAAVGVFGLPLLFAALGGVAFLQAGIVANQRTVAAIEDHYGVALGVDALDLPEEETSVPVVVPGADGDVTGELTRLDGRYHLMVPNDRFQLVEYGR